MRTVSLFDDDTGEAIDVSGRTLAAPGDFTGSNWIVTDGDIVTASISDITIKDYPFGNEMQAIPAIVGADLGILPGDPITFADQTGLNTLTGVVTSYVASTGAIVIQVGSAFDFEIRGHRHGWDGGFGPTFGIGDSATPIIKAQLGNGITVVDIGQIQILIRANIVQKLRHRTYSEALALYNGPDTRQIYVGKLPIVGGNISTAPFATQSSNPYGLP